MTERQVRIYQRLYLKVKSKIAFLTVEAEELADKLKEAMIEDGVDTYDLFDKGKISLVERVNVTYPPEVVASIRDFKEKAESSTGVGFSITRYLKVTLPKGV